LRISSSYVTYTIPTAVNEIIWYRRYGHINIDYVKKALNFVKGMPITKKGYLTSCHSCLTAKQYRTSQRHAKHENVTKFGDLFSCDFNGTLSISSTIGNGTYYLLIMTDYAIKVSFVRLIKHKDEASAEVIKFCKFIEIQHGIKIKRWLSDGGTEFNMAKDYCESEGMA
jgi:hypothetical protein